jgi:hypothetical protein
LWEFPVDDGLVLARQDFSGLFLLSPVARLLWNELQRGIELDQVVADFAARFGILPEVARRDVEATVAAWQQDLLAPLRPPLDLKPGVVEAGVVEEGEMRSIDCIVNGQPIRVLLESGDVWKEIAPRLEPLRMDGLSPQRNFAVMNSASDVLVLRDGVCVGKEENTAGARALLLQAIVSLSEPAAILHAGGCGGVLLAGHTHSGKSTLCAALMARGLPYHCDDSAVLDQEYRVAPMPFPLMLRQGSWPLLEAQFPVLNDAPVFSRWGTDVRFLTPVQPSGPSVVTALVFIKHEAVTKTHLAELSVFDCLLALQRSGFWVEHTQASIERFLGWLAGIRRYNLDYSKLDDAERVIVALAATATSPPLFP